MPSSKVPAAVCDKGRPALSSASIPQRSSKAETRDASIRSGVTKRGGAARRLDRLAQRDGDGLRFGRRIGELGGADAGQAALARRQRVPFVAEVGGGHGVGDGAAAHRRRRAAPARRPDRDLAARHAHPVEQQLQMKLRVGFFGSALARPDQARPIRHRACVRDRLSAGRTTAPPGIRATRASKAATAGAAVVMPAAMVKPSGGDVGPTLGGGAKQGIAARGEVDPALGGERCRPLVEDRREARSSDNCQCAASSGASATASARRAGSTSSISSASSARARSAARRSASAAPPSVVARTKAARLSSRDKRIDRGRDRLRRCVGRVERAADAVVELGIADRDQARAAPARRRWRGRRPR